MRRAVWFSTAVAIYFRAATFVGTSSSSEWRVSRVPRRLSREELLLSGEGMALTSDLPAVKPENMLLNSAIALAGVLFFLYMSYEFWTRIAFGKPFGTAEPVIIPKPEGAFAPEKKKKPVGIKGKVSIGMDADTNRGRRVLGLDALIFAYIMFAAAAAMLVFGVIAAYYPIYSGQVAMSSRWRPTISYMFHVPIFCRPHAIPCTSKSSAAAFCPKCKVFWQRFNGGKCLFMSNLYSNLYYQIDPNRLCWISYVAMPNSQILLSQALWGESGTTLQGRTVEGPAPDSLHFSFLKMHSIKRCSKSK